MALLLIGILISQVFFNGVQVDATTLGILALLLVLLVLPRLVEFSAGGVSFKLEKLVDAVADSGLGPLDRDETEDDGPQEGPADEVETSEGSALRSVGVLRGQLRDRLNFIAQAVFEDECCQDSLNTIERLRRARFITDERARVLSDILIAADQIVTGTRKPKRLDAFIRSGSRAVVGLKSHVFEALVWRHLTTLGAEVSIPLSPELPADFRVEKEGVVYLIETKAVMHQRSTAVQRSAEALRSYIQSLEERREHKGLIVLPNGSRAMENFVVPQVQLITLDRLTSGDW